jgi:uncharacterized repeat protein (TIGR01451 family)
MTALPSLLLKHLRSLSIGALVLLAMLTPILEPLARQLPSARAAIAPQPTASVASVVACIQPAQPSYTSPRLATTCFGSAWDKSAYSQADNITNGDANAGDPALVSFGDDPADTPGSEQGHVPLATLGQVGAVYGTTYSSGSNPAAPAATQVKRAFVSAYTKRLTRYGPAGPGGIYEVNLSTGSTRPYVQVPGVVPGPATAQSGPAGFPNTPGDGSQAVFPNGLGAYTPELGGIHTFQHDSTAIPFVGYSGLGAIRLDAFERYLYAVNLRDRRIYRFDTWAANPQASVTVLPDVIAALQPCAARGGVANYRPFALYLTSSSLYLGGTCTAETTGNRAGLGARVDRLDLSTGTWSNALGTALLAYDAQRGTLPSTTFSLAWQPWSNDKKVVFPAGGVAPRPMPILAGISVTEDGRMQLGLRDRTGDVGANYRLPAENGRAFGDLLPAEPAGFGHWGAPNPLSEVYSDSDTRDNEKPWGGVTTLPGSHSGGTGSEVVTTYLAPFRANSAGVAWFPASGGAPAGREELYWTGQNNSGDNPTTFAKTSGLGDLELLCPWRKIGDRIWLDLDANGVQDAGEVGIPGVRLQLVDPQGQVVAMVTTDAQGSYAFYVDPFAAYTVRIDPSQLGSSTGPLAGLRLTDTDAGGDDTKDSDTNAQGQIAVPSAGNRDVNLTYDAGLTAVPAPTPNVFILKRGPAVADAFDPLTYTLEYGNSGQAPAANVVVTDRPPPGLVPFAATPPWTSVSNGVYTWNLGTLAPGATGQIQVRANATVAGADLTNVADITTSSSGDIPTDNHSEVTTHTRLANVYVQKVGPASVLQGSQIGYTLVYGNTGPDEAVNVVLSDILPAGVTFVSASPAPNATSTSGPAWNLGTLEAGAQGQIAVVVQLASGTAGTVTNQAVISTDSEQSNRLDDQATVRTDVLRPDVAITKLGPASAPVGSQISYTLAYTNVGTLDQGGATVTDTLPVGLTFVSASPAPTSVSGQTLTWTVGPLAAGSGGRITVVAQVALGAAPQVTNTAVITGAEGDLVPDNNQSSVSTDLTRPNVTVQKTGPAAVVVGDQLTYTLSYRNTGTGTADPAEVVDTLPAGLTFVSASPAPANVSGQTLTWSVGPLAPGATGQIAVVARATASAPTRITNTATISTTVPGDDPGDNSSSVGTDVRRPNVAIAKRGAASVWAGSVLTYTLAYSNTGDAPAAGAEVVDTLPAELTFVSASPAPTSTSGQTLRWALGTLAPGASGQITVVARLRTGAGLPAQLRNTGTISTTTPGDNPGDNSSSTDTQTRSGSVGDTIWKDDNGDGVQQPSETGIPGVTVQLIDPRTGAVIATTVTDAQGHYQFTGLALGDYAVRIAPDPMNGQLTGMTPTTPTAPGTTLTPTAPDDMRLDIGLRPQPTTAIRLGAFSAHREERGVRVRFTTLEERDTRAIEVWRSTTGRMEDAVKIASLTSQGTNGGTYEVLDTEGLSHTFNAYWLREVERGGATTLHGPVQDRYALYLPQVRR